MSTKRTKSIKKRPQKVAAADHPLTSARDFTNRETGWLNFNKRVLNEAEDPRTPLLEAIKFLSICGSNMDEFFMKRVGRLKRHVAFGLTPKSSDGQTPIEQLNVIRGIVSPMLLQMAECFKKLKTKLEKENIFLLKWDDFTAKEKENIKTRRGYAPLGFKAIL